MSSNSDKWIRIFDVSEISKHRKGFTIYKILSMLYPENCPDAVTKILVWKRYDDIKRLHQSLKLLHKKYKFKDKFPTLPKSSFFHRFDAEIIEQRRQAILLFLEYIGDHFQLFTCEEFVKFFETSHSPVDQFSSPISSIRADLNLPEGPEYAIYHSDEEPTISDTDSVTTLNSLACSSNSDRLSLDARPLSKSKSAILANHSKTDPMRTSTTSSIMLLDGQIFPTPPTTPMSMDYAQYIIDASIHINIAVELENDKKYEEAFTAYSTAITILLKYGKDDTNYDRKQLVRYKTEKYLIRAEKIYNMHLSTEIKTIKELTESAEEAANDEHFIQRPISDLYKYKVVRIIASGMLVLHSEFQQLFYIKVVHKTVKFSNENLILPENVPYMIRLYNYFNCENALFLVLEYSDGKPLWDYIKHRADNSDGCHQNQDEILKQMEEFELSEPESEQSFSDLINDYKSQRESLKRSTSDESTEAFEHVTLEADNPLNAPIDFVKQKPLLPTLMTESTGSSVFERHFSQMSSLDEVDVPITAGSAPQQDVVKWTAQLVLALEKLHALGIICFDLQPHNLLINDANDLVLTYMCNINEFCDVFNKKRVHLAPELYSFGEVTPAVDWWSFGLILYELLVGMPLSVIHPDGLTTGTHLKIPKFVLPEGRSLLKQLLKVEPVERLGFGRNGVENIKSHPFFYPIRWTRLTEKYDFL